MKALVTLLLAIVLVVYPLIVYFGLTHFEPRVLGIILFVMIAFRIALLKGANRENLQRLLPITCVLATTCLLVAIFNSKRLLMINPFLISMILLAFFAFTLLHPPPMIERLARLQIPNLPPSAVAYCRKVTIVWCCFFAINGSISLWTALQHQVGDYMQIWTIYNGLVSYVLMGLLGVIEYLVRRSKTAGFDREMEELAESEG